MSQQKQRAVVHTQMPFRRQRASNIKDSEGRGACIVSLSWHLLMQRVCITQKLTFKKMAQQPFTTVYRVPWYLTRGRAGSKLDQ